MDPIDEAIKQLTNECANVSNEFVKNRAEELRDDLRAYARAHKKTGDLMRNIEAYKGTQTPKNIIWWVNAKRRMDYSDHSYHAMTFFTYTPAKRALARALQKQNNKKD